jgi:hypothetical protein
MCRNAIKVLLQAFFRYRLSEMYKTRHRHSIHVLNTIHMQSFEANERSRAEFDTYES